MDLTEARRLEAAATTGPWMFAHLPDKEWPNFEWYVWGAPSAVSVGDATSEANAAFIAYMRNNATDYFDAVEQRDQLREALERLLGALDGATHGLFEEWPATQGAVQAEGILIADLEPEISIADAVLARLREPEQQGSGDEEGDL